LWRSSALVRRSARCWLRTRRIDAARFAGELRDALTRAGEDFDLAGQLAVLGRWHARAVMAANPLTAEEQAQVSRVKAGDVTGFSCATTMAPGALSDHARLSGEVVVPRSRMIWLQIADQQYHEISESWLTGAWSSWWRTPPPTPTRSATRGLISGVSRSR